MGKLAKAYVAKKKNEQRVAAQKLETWFQNLSEYDQKMVLAGWYGVPQCLRWNTWNRVWLDGFPPR